MGDSKSLEIMDKGIVNPGTGKDLLKLERKLRQPERLIGGVDVFGALKLDKLQKSYKGNEELRRPKIKSKKGEGKNFLALEKEMEKKGIVGSDERIAYVLKKRGYKPDEIEQTDLDYSKEVIPSLEKFPPVREVISEKGGSVPIDVDDGENWLEGLEARNKNLATRVKPTLSSRDASLSAQPAGEKSDWLKELEGGRKGAFDEIEESGIDDEADLRLDEPPSWQEEAEARGRDAEAEMPGKERKFSAAKIEKSLIEFGLGIKPTEAGIFLSLVMGDVATNPNFGFLMTALYGTSLLFDRIVRSREIRRGNVPRDRRYFIRGFCVGGISIACGEMFDFMINTISADTLKHSGVKSLILRGWFNYLMPRLLTANLVDGEAQRSMMEGVRLGVVMFSAFPVFINYLDTVLVPRMMQGLEEFRVEAVQTAQAAVSNTPGPPAVTEAPAVVAASATPTAPAMPTVETVLATATQMAGEAAQDFIDLFEEIKPGDNLTTDQVIEIKTNLEILIYNHPDQLSAAGITRIEGVNRPPLYGIDINGDGVFDFVRTWNGQLMERIGDSDNFKPAVLGSSAIVTYDQLLGK